MRAGPRVSLVTLYLCLLSPSPPWSLGMRHAQLSPMSALSRPADNVRLSKARPGPMFPCWPGLVKTHSLPPPAVQAGPVFTQRMCVKVWAERTWPGLGRPAGPGRHQLQAILNLLLLHYNYYGVISNWDLRLKLQLAYCTRRTTSTRTKYHDVGGGLL